MLFNASVFLRHGAIDRSHPVGSFLHNSVVEAFAGHLRNLLMFLYPDVYPPRPDDVLAHHFLAGPSPRDRWLKVRPRLSPQLRRAKDRADKEIAHLTSKRIAGSRAAKDWRFVELGSELRSLIEIFVREADPARLGSSVAWIVRERE
jgi:hypothetical protein